MVKTLLNIHDIRTVPGPYLQSDNDIRMIHINPIDPRSTLVSTGEKGICHNIKGDDI